MERFLKPETKTQIYMKHIGHLTTEQFSKLQIFLGQVDVPVRYGVLFNQLVREIEIENEDNIL